MSNFNPKQAYQVPPITSQQLREASEAVLNEVTTARVAIAKIEGFLSGVPKSRGALMNPIYLQEALESSEIENINTTLLDVLQQQLNPVATKKDASQLVVNYFFALHWGISNIGQIGLSSRLIKGLHKELLPTDHDDYRRLPVVISDGRGKVRYTPPQAQHIPNLISGWQKLVNESDGIDPLVVAAAAHYQFEAIHPFSDGNGRTGRMLLTLHLMHAGLLRAPAVHISQYINANRPKYYRLLRAVTESGELAEFVKYIVRGFAIQAEHSFVLLQSMQSLQNRYKREIRDALPNMYSFELIESIFNRPVQAPVQLAKDLDVHYVTASKYLQKLASLGYLAPKRSGRHMFYINTNMLNMLEHNGRLRLDESAHQQ